MSVALETRPTTVPFGLANGQEREVPFRADTPVSVYLKDLGSPLSSGQTAVLDGVPVSEDTIVPEGSAVTVAERPKNG